MVWMPWMCIKYSDLCGVLWCNLQCHECVLNTLKWVLLWSSMSWLCIEYIDVNGVLWCNLQCHECVIYTWRNMVCSDAFFKIINVYLLQCCVWCALVWTSMSWMCTLTVCALMYSWMCFIYSDVFDVIWCALVGALMSWMCTLYSDVYGVL